MAAKLRSVKFFVLVGIVAVLMVPTPGLTQNGARPGGGGFPGGGFPGGGGFPRGGGFRGTPQGGPPMTAPGPATAQPGFAPPAQGTPVPGFGGAPGGWNPDAMIEGWFR